MKALVKLGRGIGELAIAVGGFAMWAVALVFVAALYFVPVIIAAYIFAVIFKSVLGG